MRSKPNATSKSVIQGYRPFLSSPVFKNQFLSLYVWQAVRMGENQLAFIVMSIFKPQELLFDCNFEPLET